MMASSTNSSRSIDPATNTRLRGLAGTPSKTAKDFPMSIAKDDPDPMMRRVAVRAVSGAMGRRVFIRVGNPATKEIFRNKGAMIDSQEPGDLDYLSLGQFPDDEDQMFLQPGADMDLSLCALASWREIFSSWRERLKYRKP
jgi:hypothetical protein